jgi:hypothetical protein
MNSTGSRTLPVALAVFGVACCLGADSPGATHHWQKTVTLPRMTEPHSLALSPDGAFVAVDGGAFGPGGEGETGSMVEVREVQSAKVAATFNMPKTEEAEPWQPAGREVQYCDNGRYLLVSDWAHHYFVLDTATYRQRYSIDLNALGFRPPSAAEISARYSTPEVRGACAANGKIAVFNLSRGRFGIGKTKVFDLEAGKEIPGSDSMTGAVNFPDWDSLSGIAVSPSGASLAMLFMERALVVDLRTRAVSRVITIHTGAMAMDNQRWQPQVMFAGESAVGVTNVITGFQPMIRIYDIHTGSALQEFGDPSEGAYGSFSVSADGRTVVGHIEKRVRLVQDDEEMSRAELPRFILWDRPSGKIVAPSASLALAEDMVEGPWGSGRSFREVPEIEISQNGKVVAALWLLTPEPVRVFRLE